MNISYTRFGFQPGIPGMGGLWFVTVFWMCAWFKLLSPSTKLSTNNVFPFHQDDGSVVAEMVERQGEKASKLFCVRVCVFCRENWFVCNLWVMIIQRVLR